MAAADGGAGVSRLTEAAQHLARVEALLEGAARLLGAPLAEPLRYMAGEVESLRRRVRNAKAVATGRADDAG
jgi:hypothetical protein